MRRALDLFAGAGGWDVAARPLGWDVDRVENWAPANATAEAAGFGKPIHEDVRTFYATRGAYDLVIASPSCKKFSMAGDGTGRSVRDLIIERVRAMGRELRAGYGIGIEPDAALTLEPLRIILECEPRAVALEQAPAVLPIWEAYATALRTRGYAVWTGVVDAADFGVPQNRKRAVLLARRDVATVEAPRPAHAGAHVSMAEALGWGMVARPSMTVTGGGSYTGGAEPFGNAARRGMVRELEAGRWMQRSNYSAPGRAGQTAAERGRTIRQLDQPSLTITGKAFSWTTDASSAMLRPTPEEVARLQTFPDGYPFQGGKGQRYQQIGNAVPPRLAEALLKVLLP